MENDKRILLVVCDSHISLSARMLRMEQVLRDAGHTVVVMPATDEIRGRNFDQVMVDDLARHIVCDHDPSPPQKFQVEEPWRRQGKRKGARR